MRISALALLAVTSVIPASAYAAVDPCISDCYGVSTGARAASGSASESKVEYGGVTFLSASASYFVPGEEVYSGPNNANASTDIAAGAVRARAQATAGGAEADAYWYDYVTFDLQDGASAADIALNWNIGGSNEIFTYIPSDIVSPSQNLSAFFRVTSYTGGDPGDSIDFSVANCEFGLCALGPVSHTFYDTLTVQEGVNYLFEMSLYVFGQNFDKDFSHTAFLNLTLPDHVAMRSSSGALLSTPISPGAAVPEPATWALLILGFGLVGVATRRRQPGLKLRAA